MIQLVMCFFLCVLAVSVSLVAVHMPGWLGAQSDFLVNETTKL
jgi:hypothetical protein